MGHDDYSESLKQLKLIVEFQSETTSEMFKDFSGKVKTFQEMALIGSGKTLLQIPHFPIQNSKTKHFAIYYTSGSTGKPKGVIHSHYSFVALMTNIRRPVLPGVRGIIPHPLGHISGSVMMPTLLDRGMTVIFLHYTPVEKIVEIVHKYRVSSYAFSANAATELACSDFSQ